MPLKANYRCIPEVENYWNMNGKSIHLFVIKTEHGFIHFAQGDNGRQIQLNGYAWANTLRQMENELL